jgi:hypothetical protein
VKVAAYVRGVNVTRSASRRATKVSHALPTAPPECPSLLANSVTVNFSFGFAASTWATRARNSPGRAFEPVPGGGPAGAAVAGGTEGVVVGAFEPMLVIAVLPGG